MYEDIISIKEHEPKNRVRMPRKKRSAQFAPFAALTGFEDRMSEKSRLTDKKRELCEIEIDSINSTLNNIKLKLSCGEKVSVKMTYFVKDTKKPGGAYISTTGVVKRIDDVFYTLYFHDIPPISIADLAFIEIQHS